jgi:hypothetical protein
MTTAVRLEQLRKDGEQRPVQKMRAENEVPRSGRQLITVDIDERRLEGYSRRSAASLGNLQADVRNISDGDIQSALREPDGVTASAASDVERGASRWQQTGKISQQPRWFLWCSVQASVFGIPLNSVFVRHLLSTQ